MNLIRVFPRRTSLTPTDPMAFIGNPRLDMPQADEVFVSCTFTWDKPEAERLAMAWGQYYPVKLGGPAYNSPCDTFATGMYVKQGVIFVSRGCNNDCPWCLVRKREGKHHLLPIQAGNIVNDNNVLQCPKPHLSSLFQMLRKQKQIQFTGGLDCREMTQEIADDLRSLKIDQMFFAADTKGSLRQLNRVRGMFPDNTDRHKLRCYVLLAFNGQTFSEAVEQLERVWAAGFMPHAQLFQPENNLIEYPPKWKWLARRWSRPAAMCAMNGKDVELPNNGGV